jgi:uncharacterized small protein (DUF1192 family)
MTLVPYELLVRFDKQGDLQGISLKQWDLERDRETPPEALDGTSDPCFQIIIGESLTSAIAQTTELQAQLAQAQSEAASVPQLSDRIAQLETEAEQLRAELEQYKNPPAPAQDWVGLGAAIAQSSLYHRLTDLIEDDVLNPPLETTLLSTLFRMGMAATLTKSLPSFLDGVNKLREVLAGGEHAITLEEESEIVSLLRHHGFV